MSLNHIYQEFPEQRKDVVRQTVSRMAKSGLLDAPERGWYQSMKLKPTP